MLLQDASSVMQHDLCACCHAPTQKRMQGSSVLKAAMGCRDFAHQAPQEGSFLETDTTGHGPCRELYQLIGQELVQGERRSLQLG